MEYSEVLGWIALVLMAIGLPIFVIWAIVQWVQFFQKKIQLSKRISLTITAQLVFYALLTSAVIFAVIINIAQSIEASHSLLGILLYAIITFLGSIGFIAITLEVARRLHVVAGGLIFMISGIYLLASILMSDLTTLPLFNEPGVLVVFLFLTFIALAASGIILILRGKSIYPGISHANTK
ncbi:MAG: hypothetical protein WCS74_00285 [Dehalococcoidales bacterium]|jgi:hypothetical protein|nr:hypothetical protein [Dehalococcoidales bacterium]MDD3264358.1 hypothetical protein [Dehalococcoidales bacterium]MDD4322124.1 hypothetical protein [Dehalococcoidales bacterium]MDD4793694.1 hypothetical protein [Dehalococcoidales bacterium]MDD5122018.1 hypothetical protein [Dehalococcoidales bacterium]